MEFKKVWKRLVWGMVIFASLMLIGKFSNTIKQNSTLATTAPTIIGDSEWLTSDQIFTSTVSGEYLGQPFQQDLTYAIIGNDPVFEGDILLNLDENPTTSGLGLSRSKYNQLWPNGTLIYMIDPNLPAQERIHDAIAHWEANTSIRFIERTESNASQYPNYVLFRPSMGCSSYVGMVGGEQPLNLALACSTGNTIHEIGHALGLWHEQGRADRNQYVTIHYENIQSMYAFNFDQVIDKGQDIGDYDYASIMHYPRWAFSKNGKDTIVPLTDVQIGQRDQLSQGDIDAIEYMYSR